MAAHLALMGFKVTLYNRTANGCGHQARRGIDLEAMTMARALGRLARVTSDMAEALALEM